MSAEWKPGEVAWLVYSIGVTTFSGRAVRGDRFWFTSHGHTINKPVDVRHPVVIDPEDREQVERLWELYRDTADEDARDGMQAALREFASPTPPKPEEPQGLGAVVEDADGDLWVRVRPSGRFRKADGENRGRYCLYADITAVKVLSEGVVTR